VLNLEEKKAVVADLHARSQSAQAAILADHRGLTVGQMNTLRSRLREQGVFFQVVKNNLARRAFEGTDFEPLSDSLKGPSAVALSEDPVGAAKVLTEFAKDNEALELKAGVLQGKAMAPADLEALAKLPSREELITKVAVGLNAPIVKLARSLNEVPASFARALAAVRDQKGEAA
jgi:large subunit ribosomal protein L10